MKVAFDGKSCCMTVCTCGCRFIVLRYIRYICICKPFYCLGISARINYFEEMTVSVVCLSNFLTMHYAGWIYPTNFENVDSRLGTLQDFEQMVQKLHDNNIKVSIMIYAISIFGLSILPLNTYIF